MVGSLIGRRKRVECVRIIHSHEQGLDETIFIFVKNRKIIDQTIPGPFFSALLIVPQAVRECIWLLSGTTGVTD